ncbi:MAG: hypothetical protein R3323_10355, partial [Wenzhouxiangellaceae bacterium]|nr:hypothetical protein [Wenzhouxiangellaceae bacterium]
MRFNASLLCRLLVLGLVLAPGARIAAATLESLPYSTWADGEILVRGLDYPAGAIVRLGLIANADGSETPLPSTTADDSGRLLTTVSTPDLAPGGYRMAARDEADRLLATTAHTILAAPSLQLLPASGAPGLNVRAELADLPPGTVELLYDGVHVLGPVPHAGGFFSGAFVVPGDRPVPIGGPVTVTAIARTGGA